MPEPSGGVGGAGVDDPTVPDGEAPSWRRTLWLAPVAMVLVAVLALPGPLGDGDPSALLRIGDDSASRSFVERSFPEPTLNPGYGHDGQQFYVLAETFPDLEAAEGHVDKLRYRARRVLFPALVAPLPSGAATVYGMLAVNLLAVGAAAMAVGRLAGRLGAPPALGLVVPLTPAMVDSVQGSLADALAFALALWAVDRWRHQPWLAALLLVLAGLSRETTLVVAVACLLVAPSRRHRLAMAAPVVAFGAWVAFVSLWLPPTRGAVSQNILADALTQTEWPFVGWIDIGLTSRSVLYGALVLVAGLLAAWWLRRSAPEVSLWLVADSILLVVAIPGVIFRMANFARLAPLALPALAIALVARLRADRPEPPEALEAERATGPPPGPG